MTSTRSEGSLVLVAGSAAPELPRPDRWLLTAWLLLMLDRDVTHGYAMRGELDSRGLSFNPATVYRALRKLESEGWVASRWMESVAGPRRRCYHLTAKGRCSLDEVTATITITRDFYDSFLRARTQSLVSTAP